MAVETLTFGCRLNAAESDAMHRRAIEAGVSDALLVNTCAVTGEAVRQARQAIRRARREVPSRRVVVSGCAAQVDPQGFAAMREVDRVLGNREKLTVEAYRPAGPRMQVGDILRTPAPATRDAPSSAGGYQARAFVEVQNGCDHRCTFCIIPYGRGASRSVPARDVVAAARRLVAAGTGEIVLTGVDITAWGLDLPGGPRLGSLVRGLLRAVPELKRLRLSSLDPVEIDADLFAAFAEEARLMPYLHLSLQSGDDMVLTRMKRRHRRADALRLCAELRRIRPDVVLGADLIAGFPTEDEPMFAGTLALVADCDLTILHVFPYSPRGATPAARMPQVAMPLVRERAATLRARASEALAARLAAEQGAVRSVIAETPRLGRTEHYLPVRLADAEVGRIFDARVTGSDGRHLAVEHMRNAA